MSGRMGVGKECSENGHCRTTHDHDRETTIAQPWRRMLVEIHDGEATVARILVADDSASIRSLLAATLAYDGHDVIQAIDGASALRLLTSESFEIAILDVRMPHLDGLTLCSLLRDAPGLDDLGVIIVSADSSEMAALTAGADAFFSKPFSPTRLRVTVAQLAGEVYLDLLDPRQRRCKHAEAPSSCMNTHHHS